MVKDDDITLHTVLRHIATMKTELLQQFAQVGTRLDKVENRLGKVEGRLGNVEGRLDKVDTALQRLYTRRLEMVGRLDHIEEEELPAIKQAVGLAA